MKFNIPSFLTGVVIGLLAGYILMICKPIVAVNPWKEAADSLQSAMTQPGTSLIVWPDGEITMVKNIWPNGKIPLEKIEPRDTLGN